MAYCRNHLAVDLIIDKPLPLFGDVVLTVTHTQHSKPPSFEDAGTTAGLSRPRQSSLSCFEVKEVCLAKVRKLRKKAGQS